MRNMELTSRYLSGARNFASEGLKEISRYQNQLTTEAEASLKRAKIAFDQASLHVQAALAKLEAEKVEEGGVQ